MHISKLLCLLSYGIPVASMVDGPSGIRMDNGQKTTQTAIGTLLAATWNTELVDHSRRGERQELFFWGINH
ncbi:hypothetical protein E2R60_12560 [Paenibacillus dendritiformis]|nr:hypothetical protein E2R60_12560 [Paenibacillus dendritiformis]